MIKKLLKNLIVVIAMVVLCMAIAMTVSAETSECPNSPWNGEHEYQIMVDDFSCTEVRYGKEICNYCGDVREFAIQPIGGEHNWIRSTYDSCKIEYYCSLCYDTKTEILHDWVISSYDFNCEEGGTKYYSCEYCGESKTEVVEPADHVWYEEDSEEPTCGNAGWVYYECKICYTSKFEDIPATGEHSWYKVDRAEPTCGNSGYIFYHCENCYTTKTEDIPATGEHELYWDSDCNATCVEDGTKTSYCKNCESSGFETVIDEGSALGHDFNDNWSVLTTATCSQSGVSVRVCKRCAEIESQVESAYGHFDNDGNGKCDECSVVLENSGTVTPDDTTPDTPDEPSTDVPEEETNSNPFSDFLDIIMNFIQQIKDFFNNIFK